MLLEQEVIQVLSRNNIQSESFMGTQEYSITILKKGIRLEGTPFNHTRIFETLMNCGYNPSRPYKNPSRMFIPYKI